MGVGWGGHHKPEQQLPSEGRAADSRRRAERAPPWWPGRAGKVNRESRALPSEAWWELKLWALVPGVPTWPRYAHGHTYRAVHDRVTLHRTQTHSSRQQCRRWAQGGRVGGGHLSKATRKLPGSNENMSFRLKAAGEQELKICNRNGGLSGGGWGGRRPGVQS